MASQRRTDRLAAHGIPQPCRLVSRRRDYALAVGAERRVGYPIPMAPQGFAHGPAGFGLPNPHRPVLGRRDDAFAIGTERRTHHIALVALENPSLAQRLP